MKTASIAIMAFCLGLILSQKLHSFSDKPQPDPTNYHVPVTIPMSKTLLFMEQDREQPATFSF